MFLVKFCNNDHYSILSNILPSLTGDGEIVNLVEESGEAAFDSGTLTGHFAKGEVKRQPFDEVVGGRKAFIDNKEGSGKRFCILYTLE